MALVIAFALVGITIATTNRIKYGTWLRPLWAWRIWGTDELLAAYRASGSRNRKLLEDLQWRLAGLDVTVFGSSIQSGRFANDHRWRERSDVDLMIEVDMSTFVAWAAKVYGTHPMGTADEPQTACAAGCCGVVDQDGVTVLVEPYEQVSVTRSPRRAAAKQLLGVDFGDADVDVFLFPHEFVQGEMTISAWDDPERSFRDEVMAGEKLAKLRPGRVPLAEYFTRGRVMSFNPPAGRGLI